MPLSGDRYFHGAAVERLGLATPQPSIWLENYGVGPDPSGGCQADQGGWSGGLVLVFALAANPDPTSY